LVIILLFKPVGCVSAAHAPLIILQNHQVFSLSILLIWGDTRTINYPSKSSGVFAFNFVDLVRALRLRTLQGWF